jgi:hypothetical protein
MAEQLRTRGRTREEAASELALALELVVNAHSGTRFCAVSPIDPDSDETWIATEPVRDGFEARLADEADRLVDEALEVEASMAHELAEQGDETAKAIVEITTEEQESMTEVTNIEQPKTKQDLVVEVLDWAGANPGMILRNKSGEITLSADEAGVYTINEKEYKTEPAVKRLGRCRLDILSSFEQYESPAAADDAQDEHDEKVRERLGSQRKANGNRSGTRTVSAGKVENPYTLPEGIPTSTAYIQLNGAASMDIGKSTQERVKAMLENLDGDDAAATAAVVSRLTLFIRVMDGDELEAAIKTFGRLCAGLAGSDDQADKRLSKSLDKLIRKLELFRPHFASIGPADPKAS